MTLDRENTPGKLMRHALGVACYGTVRGRRRWTTPYRNYFDASSETAPLWDALVAQGFARTSCGRGYEGWYCVTEDGKRFALDGISYSKHHAARWGYGDEVNP